MEPSGTKVSSNGLRIFMQLRTKWNLSSIKRIAQFYAFRELTFMALNSRVAPDSTRQVTRGALHDLLTAIWEARSVGMLSAIPGSSFPISPI